MSGAGDKPGCVSMLNGSSLTPMAVSGSCLTK